MEKNLKESLINKFESDNESDINSDSLPDINSDSYSIKEEENINEDDNENINNEINNNDDLNYFKKLSKFFVQNYYANQHSTLSMH